MAGFLVVGLAIAMLVLLVSLLGPFLAPQMAPLLGLTLDVTPLTLYFFVFATLYNAILLSIVLIQGRRERMVEGEAAKHVFSIMIPCRNEERVIGETVSAQFAVDYPNGKFEVLVINDGSTDHTPEILDQLRIRYKGLRVLNVPIEESGRGKSVALNRGLEHLMKTSPFRDESNLIIGVYDADGVPKSDILKKASFRLLDPKIGAVQVLVRIGNVRDSILTMMQDIEFVTFAKVTQFARTVFRGAVALGGNGQFIRASTLKSIALNPGEYWRIDALTEDLDLGTRVLLSGEENSFLSTTCVYQYGVNDLKSLFKQRTRWSWGALQCFLSYAASLKLLKSSISSVKKLDLLYYLSAVILPPVVLMVWAISFLGVLGLFLIYNPFPAYFMVANSVCFFPIIGYGMWSVRKEYKTIMIPIMILLTTAYTYHWVICTISAMFKVARHEKPRWMVTQKRSVEIPTGPVPATSPRELGEQRTQL